MNRMSGFTLIELSIVLVIIGMIVGGILLGAELIRAAELRALISETSDYKMAVNAFRMRYNCLPGDCPFATRYFGVDPNGCPNGGGSTGTCDGDGNGVIGTINSTSAIRCEGYHFWVQLSLATLIQGKYVTVTDANCYSSTYVGGTNVPESDIGGGAMWKVFSAGPVVSGPSWPGDALYTGMYNNFWSLGRRGAANNVGLGAAMRATEAYDVDGKIDDGRPDYGKVVAPRQGNTRFSGTANCTDNPNPGLANYDLSQSGLVCSLVILTGL